MILKNDKIKYLILAFILLLVVEIITFAVLSNYQYGKQQKIANEKISLIIGKVNDKYPEVNKEEIVEILKSDINAETELKKYGLYVHEEAIFQEAVTAKYKSISIDLFVLLIFQLIVFVTFAQYLSYREKKISKITAYLKQINSGKYALQFDNMTEGQLSNLESELYKITVMLKKETELSQNQKKALAESIADISHQLKTPLTSISIMLDNLNETENMNPKIREEFIIEITKQIEWMKWLVISLLKFSKLDANAVNFKKEKIDVERLFKKVIENMAVPLEIKNISIELNGKNPTTLTGDFNWQVEAITNILKNCIEHSNENKKVYITYEENNLYTKIIIRDEGHGISKEELPHIFERFYKGKSSKTDSYGIGLALAKSIIEKDNGKILCTSEVNKGTTFEIKYAKNI